ncbi:SCO family protein [Effusibacillus consociatus]|uniref:SCO family protein n=1 Tax=Effusibacillus consociatus TaxID=1117041 RepID=A0ABV9Q6R4_9BACL
MNQYLRKHWFNFVAAALIITVIAGIGYWLWWGATRLPFVSRAPEFTLTNVEGKPVHFSELNGKIRLVNFFYANCPDVCPLTTSYMANVQENLKRKGIFGKDAVFVSISFDEKRDTPLVIEAYANAHGADRSGWMFLRGNNEATKEIADKFGVTVEANEESALHKNKVLLVDRDNNIRRVYNVGLNNESKHIVAEITKDIARLSSDE